MYTCQVCNYSTKNRSSYKRHLESLKHKKKLESLYTLLLILIPVNRIHKLKL